ncbi:Tetratricopeptide repeat-containing protein [Roseovarius nanhaiticus]|uniref:Tetratricopeptide repeat-containing protein n=1 Tax=Roseovarius nanhaiticus TaxID=573024 RepID=A0A1N7FEI7_9RHOB|nr:tetratricopeptide repeat protein [Roseovarius nanhaiticus]SEK56537.1 Tetratricopeptide repeat-containing protein [Roseovarius nanhaiticus]SIR98636.1 Tetratricopeptide repeat-containing protein [Roseovarius nanhaiticus]
MKSLVFALTLLGTAATAQTCPPAPDHSAALTALIEEARAAPDRQAGMIVSDKMWALWTEAPDARAQELLDEGMERRQSYDYDGAMTAFEALVDYCPDYAEGYNQRAFIRYLREEFEAALPDLDAALARTPRHVAALTGKALTLVALGRNGEAALALRAALDMNPWLSERALLPVLEQGEDAL